MGKQVFCVEQSVVGVSQKFVRFHRFKCLFLKEIINICIYFLNVDACVFFLRHYLYHILYESKIVLPDLPHK